MKAIAPNTVINLTGRSYDLTGATGYGVYGSKYYGWNEVYDDGWELRSRTSRTSPSARRTPGSRS